MSQSVGNESAQRKYLWSGQSLTGGLSLLFLFLAFLSHESENGEGKNDKIRPPRELDQVEGTGWNIILCTSCLVLRKCKNAYGEAHALIYLLLL